MDKMKKLIAVVIIAVIMTVAAATKITWADVTEMEQVSTESNAGRESFDISNKEVIGVEDVTFDVVEGIKPDVSIEETSGANPVVIIQDHTVSVNPDQDNTEVKVVFEPVITEPDKNLESIVTIESKKPEVITQEAPVTVETKPVTAELETTAFEVSKKEVINVDVLMFDEQENPDTKVTVVSAGLVPITHEVIPPLVTETPEKSDPQKEPDKQEKPSSRPEPHYSSGKEEGPSVVETILVTETPKAIPEENESLSAPNIVPVPEKTSTNPTEGLPKTGDTVSLYGVICLLSGIALLLVFAFGGKETALLKGQADDSGKRICSWQNPMVFGLKRKGGSPFRRTAPG